MYRVHRPPYSRELLARLAKMLPRPVGSEEELAEALAFLKKDGEVPTFARNFVVDAVHGILDRPQPTKTQPRLADDLKVLVKIDHLTARLNDRRSAVSLQYRRAIWDENCRGMPLANETRDESDFEIEISSERFRGGDIVCRNNSSGRTR